MPYFTEKVGMFLQKRLGCIVCFRMGLSKHHKKQLGRFPVLTFFLLIRFRGHISL